MLSRPTTNRLLVRHFLRRFLEHDLVSPQTDQREALAITATVIVVSTLFLAFFLAVKYQFNLFMPPGLTSQLALDDRLFFVSLSMIVMSLLAVAQWDALTLDTRDTAILGPLPVSRREIAKAKFQAVALFAGTFAVALNIASTMMRPVALPVRLPVSIVDALWLMVAHAVVTVAAAVFGFVSILALRESLRALAGDAMFNRVSAALQGSLFVALATALLLLPAWYTGAARFWFSGTRVSPLLVPPLWFVGLHEVLAGHVVDGLPRGVPPRPFALAERDATALYRGLQPVFRESAFLAVAGLGLVVFVAVVACLWNTRRLPMPGAQRIDQPSALRKELRSAVKRLIVSAPAEQAGFFMTLQVLSRSVAHRATLAVSCAVAFAILTVTLLGNQARHDVGMSGISLSLLAVQSLVLVTLLTGLRHAARVPADIRANWIFRLSWTATWERYLSGVKCAGFLALVIPVLIVLSGLYVWMLGVPLATAHFTFGAIVGALFMEVLFFRCSRLPFASAYLPAQDLQATGPLYVAGIGATSAILAALERRDLQSISRSIGLFAMLFAASAVIRAWSRSGHQMMNEPDDASMASTPGLQLTD